MWRFERIMSRQPSIETQLKTARRIANDLKGECLELKRERDAYKARLLHETRELEEWKRRFDKLLARLPEDPL